MMTDDDAITFDPDGLGEPDPFLDEPEVLICEVPGCGAGPSGGPFQTTSASGLKRHQTRTHGQATDPSEPAPLPGDDGPSAPEFVPKPAGSDKGLVQRFRERFGTKGKPKTARSPARVVPKGKRVSLAGDIGRGYRAVGRLAEKTPHYPAGRMLVYQAPGAGVIIDNALAGTAADRYVLQPLAKRKDQYEDVAYLIGPPLILFMMQNANLRGMQAQAAGNEEDAAKYQATFAMLEGALEMTLRSSLLKLAPAIAEAAKRAEEEDAIIREAFPDLPPGVDPVQVVMSSLFAPPSYEEAPGGQATASDVDAGHVGGSAWEHGGPDHGDAA